jgi:hypothetical protein
MTTREWVNIGDDVVITFDGEDFLLMDDDANVICLKPYMIEEIQNYADSVAERLKGERQ